jgi:spore coat polysaccharide biosynthesis protein SpsF
MKTVATIEARMTSSRLLGKVMLPILGRPMLELLIERLKRARWIDRIIVATTENSTDDVVEALTRRLGIGCFRGSEEDVLDRVLRAALSEDADIIVEITGDCPLIDPGVIDRLVEIYQSNSFDYVSNTLKTTFPNGLDTQVFSTRVLQEVSDFTQDPADREHVSLYIYEHPERYSLHNVESGLSEKYWDMRLTVDTIEDFQLITKIYERLYPSNPAFNLQDIVDLLEREPELMEINREIRQKPVR